MGIFRTNILKHVEWLDNTKDTLVYKYPMAGNMIQAGSKLTVRASQIAVFVNKGQIADVFQPGMYTLSTSNLPFLTQLLSLPFGFRSPFTSEIYFVSTKQFPNQKWGTSNPIVMRDKEFGTIRVKGYGSYSFRVDNATTFLKELFGTNGEFTTDHIERHLKSLIVTGITDTMASSGVSALDMAANLFEFAEIARPVINNCFKKMGLRIEMFNIENLSFPEEVEKMIDKRSGIGIMGGHLDSFTKMQMATAIGDAARNEGQGGMGASLGVGMAMAQMMQQTVNTPSAAPAAGGACGKCKKAVPTGARFCPHCGEQASTPAFCKECGASVPSGSRFCPGCGKKK
jgi:membrane protease subunit (stomatin/prohibitin family)